MTKFDPDAVIQALASDSFKVVDSLTLALTTPAEAQISGNLDIESSFYEAIILKVSQSGGQLPPLRSVFRLITTVFPLLTNEQRVQFTDAGIAFSLLDLLDSPNSDVVKLACEIVAALAPDCDYLIDSFFTFDFHYQLIDLIHQSSDESLQIAAARAIFCLYGDHDRILSTILKNSLPKLLSLVTVNSRPVVSFVLKALTEITNQRSSLAYILFDAGVVDRIVGFLDDDDLKGSVIPLLGNLCLSGRGHIAYLIHLGLPRKLFNLTGTVHAADAFWVLSNLLENAPDLYSEAEISEEKLKSLIATTLEKAHAENMQLVKEATFFLASLIIFVARHFLPVFLRFDVFDVLVRVLMVSPDVIARARFLDVFMRFCLHVQQCTESFTLFTALVAQCGLLKRIEELKAEHQSMLKLKALEIEEEIASLTKSHQVSLCT
jgi:hypothetical protein